MILRAYRQWGEGCLERLRGMFSFALWDEETQTLFAARDRFGIKPLYYTVVDGVFYFASEVKALLPFLPKVETDLDGLADYLTFQFPLAGKTLFEGVQELLPGHFLRVRNGTVETQRYWEVYFEPDFDHTPDLLRAPHPGAARRLDLVPPARGRPDRLLPERRPRLEHRRVARLDDARPRDDGLHRPLRRCRASTRAGTPAASPTTAASSCTRSRSGPTTSSSGSARSSTTSTTPSRAPARSRSTCVSELAAQHRKVVLGGQGGDEIFGGYVRYLIAYFEQCIKGAIDGTMHSGNFVVTYESIIPNLQTLREYKPLLREFWRDGLFDDLDARYFRLINRAPDLGDEIDW